MDFIVDRNTWTRGSSYDSSLLNDDGRQCCLGFCMVQVGIPMERLWNKCYPNDLGALLEQKNIDFFTRILKNDCIKYENSDLSREAVAINDNQEIDDQARQRKLQELFKKHGHTIKFIN